MNILAIGGGKKGPAIEHVREHLDRQTVAIIPTACSTPKSYGDKVAACQKFFTGLGMTHETLHGFGETPSPTKVAEVLGKSALQYVIGGNMPYLLHTLPKHGTDIAIREELKRGKTLAGMSAGGLIAFKKALSCPAKKPKEEQWEYTYLDALGVLNAAATMHGDQHDDTPNGPRTDSRTQYFIRTLPQVTDLPGIAVDNGAAFYLQGQDASIQLADPTSNAGIHIVQNGELIRAEDNTHLTELVRPWLT